MSDDADLEGSTYRPNVRPWLVAGVINVLVAAVLLGIPYVRGIQRAEEVPARWAAFAACFYDAEPADPPGLGLPAGERARYASLVLRGPSDWPERCQAPLAAIPAEETLFLFPNIKNAEAQLRGSVGLMAEELRTLARMRASGDRHVPDRPARAMQGLRGALAELGLSSGASGLDADRDAVRLPDEPGVPMASIVPLRVSEGGAWTIEVEDGDILAATLDSRSVVSVRVGARGVDQRVTRRPRLVSGILGHQHPPWALWTTSPSTCAEAVDRCEHRTTGIAAFLEDRQTLEPMMWLGAHPLGSPTRSVRISGSSAHVVMPYGEGARVGEFALIEPSVRALGEEREIPRLSATTYWDVDATEDSALAWIEGDPVRLVDARAGHAGLLELAPGATEVPFDPPPGRAPQVATCGPWIALATDRRARLRTLDGAIVHDLELRAVPPGPSRLRVVCHDDRVEVWTLADRTLSRAVCTTAGCFGPEAIAEDAASFDVTAHGAATLAVTTDDPEEGAVRVIRLADDGTRTFVPSPCWSDPPDGLCGEPRIASDGSTLAVVTRQEEDLRIVVSEDGLAFGHPAGLEQR